MQQGVWRVGIVSSITLGCFAILSPARSQIVPDTTLPTNSSVTPGCTVCTIEGGTVRGVNLFHSFSEFSVPTGGEAFFNNPSQIENILTRVTGSNISHIDGLIRANDAANLFLVNPNGIIFGVNSRLEIGGSFFASTADSLVLENGNQLYQFSASKPTAPPLLTITAPIGLQFGSTGGSIVNQSRLSRTITDSFSGINFNRGVGLEVKLGKTLGLIGGNVTLAGGSVTAGNTAVPSGNIELGSVADNSFVRLIPQANGFALGYEEVQNFGDIQLSQAARVNAGDLIINARRLLIKDGSSVFASGRAAVNASDWVQVIGSVDIREEATVLDRPEEKYYISSTWFSSLSSSSLRINTGRLLIQDGSSVSASGLGANLIVNASDSVQVIGSGTRRSEITYQSGGFFSDNSGASTTASSLWSSSYWSPEGVPGNLMINTRRLLIQDGASVWASGPGANLIVNASDSVQVIGSFEERREVTYPNQSALSYSYTLTRSSSLSSSAEMLEGIANMTINTERLLIQDGASVSSTSFGSRSNLMVKASDSVQVIGSVDGRTEIIYPNQPENFFYKTVPIPSTLSSSSYVSDSSGGGANLMIHTGQLLVKNKAQVRVFAYSDSFDGSSGGEALGNLRVSARSIRLDNHAKIGVFAQAQNDMNAPANAPANAGGNIILEVEDLVLRHNSEISTISFNLTSDFTLPNNPTFSSNDSVNVIIDKLNQARTSGSITEITNIGNLGNITINAGAITAIPSENSDIIAFDTQGGGNVTVTAQRIFGLRLPEFPGQLTDKSDITSSGTVTINTLDVDPSRGLTKLPAETVDRTQQIAQDCAAVGEDGNTFIITGRGGLPQSPEEILTRDTVLEDLGAVVSSSRGSEQEEVGKGEATSSKFDSPEAIASHLPNQLVEAQGWIRGADGQIILTAQAPTATTHRNWQPPVNCQVTPPNSPP